MSNMNRYVRMMVIGCAAMLLAALARPPVAGAAGGATFVVVTPGAYLRNDPSLVSPNTYPIFKSERYAITGRSADGVWLQLAYPDARKGAWIMAALGAVEGDLNGVPKVAPKSMPRISNARPPAPVKGVPVISAHARQVYLQSAARGRDLSMFTVVGDCNSQPTAYVGRLAAGLYDFSRYSAYQATVARFTLAWARISVAAGGGFNSAAALDPLWADHYFCLKDESPLVCELRFTRASIVFIELGTGDTHVWQDFESNYRKAVEYAVSQGVLPVLITKADALESQEDKAPQGYINDVIRKVGQEFDVPVMDFWLASRDLPNYGLIDEGNSDFHLAPGGSDLHLLMTLQTLDAIWRK